MDYSLNYANYGMKSLPIYLGFVMYKCMLTKSDFDVRMRMYEARKWGHQREVILHYTGVFSGHLYDLSKSQQIMFKMVFF